MSRPKHVVVIGAGAAGLTAGLRAAEAGARVTILNAHPKIGLKILMSGGTRCNVTHREVTERDYFGGSRHFVARVLRAFPSEEARAWLESLGVALKLEETGKYFPTSDDAQTVLDALLRAAQGAGAEIVSGAQVIRLEHGEGGGYRIGVRRVRDSAAFGSGAVAGHRERAWPLPGDEPDEWRDADAVILASGGLSFPRTGSDGTGYALVTALGHTLEPPIPALTPLVADDPLCREAQGLTLDAELTLWVGGKKRETIRGSFLITHFGYSGPAALDLSRHWLRAEGERERRVTASFVPGETRESLLQRWVQVGEAEPRATARAFLRRSLPERLTDLLCNEAGVNAAERLAQVDRIRRTNLIDRVVLRELPITGTLGYEKAEVTAGGVKLSEVDPSTLESRVSPGLYLCGEILDVEGRLGGFNFQFSWSSGTIAGTSAGSR
jgi:predicted flavoprotein YhiN